MEQMYGIRMLFGYVSMEQRRVKTGPGAYEFQGRSKRFDGDGVLIETTEWSALSRIWNVPDDLAHLLE